MKTYYCVMIEKYDDGRVLACARATERKSLPKNHTRQLPGVIAYVYWYETVAEAQSALAEVNREGKVA
jgi:hypothetical protein